LAEIKAEAANSSATSEADQILKSSLCTCKKITWPFCGGLTPNFCSKARSHFLTGAFELGLITYKCKKCGKIHYPFHDRCMNCKGWEFEEIKPEGDAKLLTFTQIFNLPWGFDQSFLIIRVTGFENGVKAMGKIRGDSIDG
jgi:hypothetical protein